MAAGLLAAEGGNARSTGVIVATMFGTLVVFWLAHGYTEVLAARITEGSSSISLPGLLGKPGVSADLIAARPL